MNDNLLPIKQTSSCCIPTSLRPLQLKVVFHVPNLKHNLISNKCLCHDDNCLVFFYDPSVSIQDKTMGTILLQVASNGNSYLLHLPSSPPTLMASFSIHQPAQVWRHWLGHHSYIKL